MRTPAWILAASLAATVPLLPCVATAQGQPVAPDRARAREHFQAGVAAYTAGDYPTALREFQDAYRIAPHPSVRVNLANCYMQLHQPVEALENFESFVRESASVPAAQRREIERQMAELRTQVGEVRLSVSPATAHDAIISVDGRTVTSTGTLRLTPGHHVIEVSADGFQAQRSEVDVLASSQRDVQITLQAPPPPTAVATSTPAGGSAAPAGGSSTGSTAATPTRNGAAAANTPSPTTTATTTSTAAEPAPVATTSNAPRPLAEPAEEHHGLPSGMFFAGVGVTAVALVGTVIFGTLAVSANSTYEDAAGRIARGEGDYQTERDRGTAAAASARQDALITDVCLGVTVVAAGVTAILYTQTDFGGERHVTVSPVVGNGGGGLVVGGSF